MHICTIIAKNYVAQARVLARSFREHNPDGTCWCLVIDDPAGYIDAADEPFELVTTEELGIEQFFRMAALYNVLELSTAVKPWLLKHLLHERGAERVAYLDPDIEVHSSLEEIDRLMHEHRLVVTPHITEPLPADGRRPSETDLLIAGAYNLGFIGVGRGPDTDLLLDWWSARLERDCIVAPERGYFVDQRWMDFAPGLVPSFHVLRDPGYNVAYWNLPSREVKRAGGGHEVNGRPLRFFHYSGYEPHAPDSLSKHQDRIALRSEPVLRELCHNYGQALLREGFDDVQDWPYTYATLPDGTPLESTLRAAYRELEGGDQGFTESIFSPGGASRFLDWLNEPLHGQGRQAVTRYLEKVWELRPDLHDSFPDIGGADGPGFLSWARVYGRSEVPIPPALLPGFAPKPNGDSPPPAAVGVNAIGYFGSGLGVGEAGRQVVSALEAGGVPLARVALKADAPADESAPQIADEHPRFPVNLLCVNADMTPHVAADMPPEFFQGRHTIGLWWWEVGAFPDEWLPSFGYVDEVWVGSHHIADALGPIAPVPVVKITQPVPRPQEPPQGARAELDLPTDKPLFLYSFDYLSVFKRKNPVAVVEAFKRAFDDNGAAALVIKSINHDSDPEGHALLTEAAAAVPGVTLVERYLPRAERDALVAAADCYVSLHRSEGFGYTLAEAMALGKPVIATGYSGNLDFMTERNSFLVDYATVPIGDDAPPYPADGEWAEPDVDHAAELMQRVVEDPGEARKRGERGRAEILEHHSLEAAGTMMAERLRRIRSRSGHRSRRGPSAAASHTKFVEERVRKGPPPPAEGTGRARRELRDMVLRLLKPYTVHQRQVDEDLMRVLRVLEESIEGLAAQQETLREEVEPALRLVRPTDLDGVVAGGELPDAPAAYWSPEYIERQREFVAKVLDDPQLLNLFKHRQQLPPRYGVRFDERVVEFPWVASRALSGRVLDAGSTLNHPHVLTRLRPRVDELHIATLAPEAEAYPSLDISYLYADLRELPMSDGAYDHVVSISTLEHVGMDTSQYGARGTRAEDPREELRRALAELRRVLKPGGTLYVTVPYGAPEDHGWLRQFGSDELDELIEAFGPAEREVTYYGYEPSGWRLVEDPARLAGKRYRDHFSQPLADDGAAAARAVACLELIAPR